MAGRTLREGVVGNLRMLMLFALLCAFFAAFSVTNPRFVAVANLMNIVRQTCVLAIISAGMTYVIISGGIDLSVGSTVALSGMIAAIVLRETGSGIAGAAAGISVGLLVGACNGLLIGKMGLAPFIATLAMMSVGRGLALTVSQATAIKVDAPLIVFLGQGDLFGGIPFSLVVLVAVFALFLWCTRSFVLGKHVYCIGGNAGAARAMGIRVDSRLALLYAISGALAGLGGLITIGRMCSAQPYAGLNLEFDVITAVVLGGTSLAGGSGTVLGTVIGSALVGVITNGLGLTDISPFFMYIVKGLLILFAVLVDRMGIVLRERRLTPKVDAAQLVSVRSTGMSAAMRSNRVLRMKHITKVFPGMKALDDVSLTLREGEIHALMGENGAGKSTLMKILAGELAMDTGSIAINGEEVTIDSPRQANELGIALIHQEFALVQELSVYQNIFLGNELLTRIPFVVDKQAMREEAGRILADVGVSLDVTRKVKDLTVSEQQMVEIAKALRANAWLLILDEPTSSLTEEGKDALFRVMQGLKEKGVCMVYISHRMQEIYDICDQITILRDGVYEGTYSLSAVTPDDIIKKMVGRPLGDIFTRARNTPGKTVLEVSHLGRHGVFRDISFEVREGEVLGFSGLMGAGRTEIARAVFGLDRYDRGEIRIDGKPVFVDSPGTAIAHGIAYVTEDRRREGFIPFMSIMTNLAAPSYPRISRAGRIDRRKEEWIGSEYIRRLGIRTSSPHKDVVLLSGGNQQKVSLGKWLATNPRLLILDEPTRGVDVGAKLEIHRIIADIARQNIAVILISSEMPELIGCSDRILVLRGGEITGRLSAENMTQEAIMEKAAYIK